ncbi:DUF1127 domain-containing protein [Microbaculum marinisediminis]|uniref:DUF1127 domain-containing protein n=1 Tax=Microbaculum marinisediminis TaxID=2931392 RepID=A0AAW5QT08_9HYPH|nr:DUF1127 domain-containing protein [Microbaculum sp. A6E488]MCT8971171.1 DUF1127 domain-containing protein [Microbaculum sp. A6E488]
MSTYQNSASPCCEAVARPNFRTGFLSLATSVLHGLRRRIERRQQRRTFMTMAALDDRILDDIGLTRRDIEYAAGLPMQINASLAVRQIAADRRAAERRIRRR